MTAVNMNAALVNEPDGLNELDDSEFVMASPLNARPGARFKLGFNVKPDARVGTKIREKKAPETAEREAAGEEAAVSAAESAPSRVQKVFRMLFFVCVMFFIGELVWLFLITPMRPFSSVVVSVVTGIEFGSLEKAEVKNELLRAAGIGAKTSYLSLDTRAAEKNLSAVPFIESAKVVKQFPGTVRITVVPRKRVALFLRNVNGKIAPVYFDKHGVVFKIGSEADAFLSVPVVSGFETEPVAEGTRLPSVYIPLFENLDKLSSASPKLYEAISEIAVNKKTYDGFDVTLFPLHFPVKIRMNAELDEETIGNAFLLLDVLKAKGEQVSEIDFRAETASYIVKGAQN
ncbi:MAG: FtsQ-type POTRA domain-containing protein [Spirochaetaceae bacterium]|jgi:cell division protein FtsQ|nr:FtsQ-type POTRA domain-containing protein [Spirochaetaceae bacterium]